VTSLRLRLRPSSRVGWTDRPPDGEPNATPDLPSGQTASSAVTALPLREALCRRTARCCRSYACGRIPPRGLDVVDHVQMAARPPSELAGPGPAQEHIDQPVDRCPASLPIRIANNIGLSSAQVVVDQADGDRGFPDRPGDPLDRPVPTSPAGNTPGKLVPKGIGCRFSGQPARCGRSDGGRPAWQRPPELVEFGRGEPAATSATAPPRHRPPDRELEAGRLHARAGLARTDAGRAPGIGRDQSQCRGCVLGTPAVDRYLAGQSGPGRADEGGHR
jgi:hypothetical protein